MSVEDLNSITEQYLESEKSCNKNRKIYYALENIFVRKEYMQNVQIPPQLDAMEVHDIKKPNTSICNNKSKAFTKAVLKCDGKVHKQKTVNDEQDKCFVLVQKQIQQFESYKNSLCHASDKYPRNFLLLLEAQNQKLSQLKNKEKETEPIH